MNPADPHPLLADRSRLLIMATLAAQVQPLNFTVILSSVGLTRGNFSVHVRKLEEAGYVEIRKEFVDRKPRTSYLCTSAGRRAVKAYLTSLEDLLKQIKD